MKVALVMLNLKGCRLDNRGINRIIDDCPGACDEILELFRKNLGYQKINLNYSSRFERVHICVLLEGNLLLPGQHGKKVLFSKIWVGSVVRKQTVKNYIFHQSF